MQERRTVYRANAASISLFSSSFSGRPASLQSIGYMLMEVKPGSVLTSLKTTRSVPFSRKKSTRKSVLNIHWKD